MIRFPTLKSIVSVLLLACPALAQDFDLSWNTVDGGGGTSDGGGYSLTGTIGQHDAGVLSTGGDELIGGFWAATVDAGVPSDMTIFSANPPADNPFVAGQQPFRDCLQTGTTPALTQGIGSATTPNEGTVTYTSVSVTFSVAPTPPLTLGGIETSCVGGGPFPCPATVALASPPAGQPGPFHVFLGGSMPPGACMTLTFAGTAAGQKLQYQYLPGDIGMNGSTSAIDVQQMVAAIASGQAALPANLPRYDINRSGAVSNTDVLRLVGLLNGLNTTQVWLAATVAACP